MILGLSTAAFTQLHVLISLIGIAAGLLALFGLLAGKLYRLMSSLFLITTVLTSVTGFLFPFHGMTPGIILGILSMIVLLLAIWALYIGKLEGAWRGTYVVTSSLALWFNFFVLIAQSFAKIPALRAIAPSQASPAFGITQAVVLIVFLWLTVRAFKRFHSAA
ncbi:MAG TPA: hypothetical protein VI320_38295 [Terracidiphilus sp.]|jgi:hypothetical protein